MKFFVIGSGSIGRRHYQNLNSLGVKNELISWRNINSNNLTKDIKLLGKKAGVIIATETKIRVSLIKRYAKYGPALYIEKPIAYKMRDLDFIYSLPKELQQRSVGGFMMRYHPIIKYLFKNNIKNLFKASFEVGHNVNHWRVGKNFDNNYASSPHGGGSLLDLCHEIDLALMLCGKSSLKSVFSTSYRNYKGVDIASVLHFANKSGLNFTVSTDYISNKFIRRGSLVSQNKQIYYDLSKNTLLIQNEEKTYQRSFLFDRNKMFLELMKEFVAISEGKKVKNPHIPRLDLIKENCYQIALAWKNRKFTGSIDKKIL